MQKAVQKSEYPHRAAPAAAPRARDGTNTTNEKLVLVVVMQKPETSSTLLLLEV